MQTLTFTCRVITPMFLAGADGSTPELRAASIKGAMRFWWRAVNGHLPLNGNVWRSSDKNDPNPVRLVSPGLRTYETAIFGGVSEKEGGAEGQRSSFSLRIQAEIPPTIAKKPLVPHKEVGFAGNAIIPDYTFKVILSVSNKYNEKMYIPIHNSFTGQPTGEVQLFTVEKLIALFQLTCMLGGLGKRARRGMGSIVIDKIEKNRNFDKKIEPIIEPTLGGIVSLLQQFSSSYRLDIHKKSILNMTTASMQAYPWIQQIEIGRRDPNILLRISQATHDTKGLEAHKYEPNMGHASKGRFASPVYVSVLPDQSAIITTLNPVPDRDAYLLDSGVQQRFKNKLI